MDNYPPKPLREVKLKPQPLLIYEGHSHKKAIHKAQKRSNAGHKVQIISLKNRLTGQKIWRVWEEE